MADRRSAAFYCLVCSSVLFVAPATADSLATRDSAAPHTRQTAVVALTGDRTAGIALPVVMDSFSFLDEYPASAVSGSDSADLSRTHGFSFVKHSSAAASFFKHRALKFFVFIFSLLIIGATFIFYRNRRKNNENFMKQTRLSIMDKEVRRACKYIENNYANPELTPEFVCRELVTGQAFLEALFERELGMKVPDFICQVRIHHARSCREADAVMSLAEIASQTGFVSVTRLQETYRQVTGKSLENIG